jgi:hypothetical protein
MNEVNIIISQSVYDKIKGDKENIEDAKDKIFHFQGSLYKFNGYIGTHIEKNKFGAVRLHEVNVTKVGNDSQEHWLDLAKEGGGKRKRRGRKSKHKQSRKSKKRKSKKSKSRKRSKTRRRR